MFEVSLETLYRYMKLRFLIIGLLIIIFTPLFSYYLPLYPQFQPDYSIYSDSDYGSSHLLPSLSQYSVSRSYRGNLSQYEGYDLLILQTPQKNPDSKFIDDLQRLYNSGTKVLLIGSVNMADIALNLGVQFASDPTKKDRIFDKTNNGGDRVYPELQVMNLTGVYGVVPTTIKFDGGIPKAVISTQSTAAYASCWDAKDPCTNSYYIGVIYSDYAVIADQFMFKNAFTDKFPENNILFKKIIQELIGEHGSIVFDESYLNWAPVNREGVENFVDVRLNVVMIVILISILAVLIPFIIGFQSNVFGSEPGSKRQSRSYSDLQQRLSYVHIERLPAAPLNLLERTLMDEHLRYNHRGRYFFQYLASDLIDYINSHQINSLVPNSYIVELNQMMNGVYSDKSSWQLIENVYQYILSNSLYKTKGEKL